MRRHSSPTPAPALLLTCRATGAGHLLPSMRWEVGAEEEKSWVSGVSWGCSAQGGREPRAGSESDAASGGLGRVSHRPWASGGAERKGQTAGAGSGRQTLQLCLAKLPSGRSPPQPMQLPREIGNFKRWGAHVSPPPISALAGLFLAASPCSHPGWEWGCGWEWSQAAPRHEATARKGVVHPPGRSRQLLSQQSPSQKLLCLFPQLCTQAVAELQSRVALPPPPPG